MTPMPSPFPSTTYPHSHVRIRDLSELTAGIPGLFGFPPSNSLVLLVFRGPHDIAVSVAMRVTLPELAHVPLVAHQLSQAARINDAVAAIAVLVGGGPDPTPQRPFVNALRDTLAEDDIVLVHASWVARLAHAEPWWCYDDPRCGGHVPDPQTSTLAAAMAVAGTATFPSRSAMARQLTPDLTRIPVRKKLLQERKGTEVPYGSTQLAEDLTLVHTMIHRAATTTSLPELTDEEAVRLARALTHMPIRDECMAYGLSTHAEAAERLWTVLVRGLPAPERAEPAALLAMSAYLRGDGVLAALAVETARKADNAHETASLLEGALQRGAPPRTIRGLLIRAIREAKEKDSEHTQDVPALPVAPLPIGMAGHSLNLTAFSTPDQQETPGQPTTPEEPPAPDDPPWETDTSPTPRQTTDPTSDAVSSLPEAAAQAQSTPDASSVLESHRPSGHVRLSRRINVLEPGETRRAMESYGSVGSVRLPRWMMPRGPVPGDLSDASLVTAPPAPAGDVDQSHQRGNGRLSRQRTLATDFLVPRQLTRYVRPSPGWRPRTLMPHDYSETPQAVAMDLLHALLVANTYNATAPSVPG